MFTSRRISVLGGDVFRDEHSLDFAGDDEYLDAGIGLGTTIGDNYAGSLSVSIWFKADAISGGLFLVGAHANGDFSVRLHDNKIKVGVNNAGFDWHYAFTDTANWHHLVGILDRANETAVLYVDGVSVGAQDGSDSFPAATTLDMDGEPAWIGRLDSSYFNGKISDVAFYNSALTASQVATIYNGREPYNHKEGVAKSNLLAWWRMGDGVFDDSNVDGNSLITDEANVGLGANLQDTAFTEQDMLGFTGESATGFTGVNTGAGAGGNDNSSGKALSLTAGHTYKLSWTTTINAGDLSQQLDVAVATAIGGGTGDTATAGTHTAAGDYVNYFKVASTATHYIVFRLAGTGAYNFTISNVSLQKVDGNPGILVNMEAIDFSGETP